MSSEQRPAVITEVLGQMGDKVVVAAQLVSFLRNGLRCELGFAAEHISKLMLELEGQPPTEQWVNALENFDVARVLLQDANLDSDQLHTDIELDLSFGALVVLKALEGQYSSEVDRLYEAGFYRPSREVRSERVRALEALLLEVKLRVQQQGGGPRRSSKELQLEVCAHAPRLRATRTLRGSRSRR